MRKTSQFKKKVVEKCSPLTSFYRKIESYLSLDRIFAAFIAAFCISSAVEMIATKADFTLVTYINTVNFARFFFIMALIFIMLIFVTFFTHIKQIIPYSLLAGGMLIALSIAARKTDISFMIGIGLILFFIICYLVKDDKLSISKIQIDNKFAFMASIALFIIFTTALALGTILRHYAYQTANYDFGIFTQMFESMKKTGLPITTLERNKVLSHFAVHFSPAFYLLLPGYMIFSTPEYLLVMQAVLLGCGIFAVYGIGKALKLSPKANIAFMLIYTFMPAIGNAAFYDFHENAFLPVFILWTCYFMIKDKTAPMFLFALLTLSVKEDAAIYIFAIGLFLIINRKKYGKGICMLLLGGTYFAMTSAVLGSFGEGIMADRMINYWVGNDGTLMDVVKTCFTNIAYLITQVFQPDKLVFLAYMLVPVMLTPFYGKKTSILILLLPMLVINLMPSYAYEHNIDFQYVFGPIALVLLASMINVKEYSGKIRKIALMTGVCVSILFTMTTSINKMRTFWDYSNTLKPTIIETNQCLEKLPEDVSITAQTFFTCRLYKYDTVFMYPYVGDKNGRTEFMIRDTRNNETDKTTFMNSMGSDYVLYSKGGYCEIYRLTDSSKQMLKQQGRLIE